MQIFGVGLPDNWAARRISSGTSPGVLPELSGDRLSGDRLSGDRLSGDRLSGDRMPPIASTCRRPSAATRTRYRAIVTDCTFCDIAAGKFPAHMVLATDLVVGFLDAKPVFKGHVLLVPRQ